MTLEISVVVPTRDRWEILSRHALPSVLEQREVELELIVVDEASSDGTPAGLAAIGDPRVRVVRNETPRRLPGARNQGAALAAAPWLAFLDDDDLWAPTKLRRQLDAVAVTGAEWAYARAIVVDRGADPIEDDPFPPPDEVASLLLGGNWIPGGGSNVIVSAAAFDACGGFDESLRFFEDWDLWLRLADRGAPGACDEILVGRVEHGANMVVRDRREVLAAYETVMSRRRPVTDADRQGVREWLALEQARAGRRLGASTAFAEAAVRHRSPGDLASAIAALGGLRGLRLASRALERVRGASHLDVERPPPATVPDWLARFRP